MATRATASATFGAATPLTAQSSTANDNNPSVSADGLSLFHSDRNGQNDLFFATRATKDVDFGAPSPVSSLNTGIAESQVLYRAGGEEAWWFVSPEGGTWVIYMAKRKIGAGFAFSAATLASELSSPARAETSTCTCSSTRGTPGNALQRIWHSARPK